MTGDLSRHAGIAYAIAGLLRALPVHAARGQLYLPADLMQRYGAQAADVFAGNATTELRAVLAELRLRARHHLGAARGLLNDSAVRSGTRAAAGRAGAAGARPDGAPQLSAVQRQATCRNGGGNGRCGARRASGSAQGVLIKLTSAAIRAPPIH